MPPLDALISKWLVRKILVIEILSVNFLEKRVDFYDYDNR